MSALYVSNLPVTAGTLFLYCPTCTGEFSATRGDYFWHPPGKPMVCRCETPWERPVGEGTPMILARKTVRIVPVRGAR